MNIQRLTIRSTDKFGYFVGADAFRSETADRNAIDNTLYDPSLQGDVDANLRNTFSQMNVVRGIILKAPVLVHSMYRCLSVNAMLGSKNTSQHTKGEAIDFTCPAFGSVMDIVKELAASSIQFDQLIQECAASPTGGWVHASFIIHGTPRRQILVTDDGKSNTLYHK